MEHLYIDLDDTLLPFDSFPRFILALSSHLKLKSLPFALQLPWLALPVNRPRIRPKIARLLKGHLVDETENWSAQWVKKKLQPQIRQTLLKENVPFTICSMSLDLVVEPLAQLLGGSALSTTLQREGNQFSGALGTVCGGAGKAQLIQENAQSKKHNLKNCALMTDHHRDIPALEVVGLPILVNPTRKLRAWGKENQAKIIEFRESHLPQELPQS